MGCSKLYHGWSPAAAAGTGAGVCRLPRHAGTLHPLFPSCTRSPSNHSLVPGVCSPFLTALCRAVVCLQDVANMFAPSVAARALTMKQALLVAAVFEFVGAVLMVSGGLGNSFSMWLRVCTAVTVRAAALACPVCCPRAPA